MRILQITDLHVSGQNQLPKGNVDTRKNLIDVLGRISEEGFDLVVLSGDICLDDPQPEIYTWVKEQFSTHIDRSKLRVIAGNHDDSLMMKNLMELPQSSVLDEVFFREDVAGYPTFFLDTAKDYGSDKQKGWLKKELNAVTAHTVLIFMHHPPVISGVPYMDQNHALKDRDDFRQIFTSFPQHTFQIFCGHYHCERTVVYENMHVSITPSCYVQIDSRFDKFVPEHYVPGYRIIELKDDHIETFVKYSI